jgi:hypothetical protein
MTNLEGRNCVEDFLNSSDQLVSNILQLEDFWGDQPQSPTQSGMPNVVISRV